MVVRMAVGLHGPPADHDDAGCLVGANRCDLIELRYTTLYTHGMEPEFVYDGIPVAELVIAEVDVPDPAHLQRSLRYAGAEDVAPADAVEAALDPLGPIARDPRSVTGEAIRVIGYSPAADRFYVVVMIPDVHPPDGVWHIATAWPASRSERSLHPGLPGDKETAMTSNADKTLVERLAVEAEHAEATRDSPLNYQQRRSTPGQTVYGLRLPSDRIEQLRRVAAARGVEPSVLARAWLLENLDRAEAGDDSAADLWEHDVREATDRLRELLDQRPESTRAS